MPTNWNPKWAHTYTKYSVFKISLPESCGRMRGRMYCVRERNRTVAARREQHNNNSTGSGYDYGYGYGNGNGNGKKERFQEAEQTCDGECAYTQPLSQITDIKCIHLYQSTRQPTIRASDKESNRETERKTECEINARTHIAKQTTWLATYQSVYIHTSCLMENARMMLRRF